MLHREKRKENVIIHKVKTSDEKVKFIFRNLYGTSLMYQFDTKQEAENFAKNNNYYIIN